MEQLVSNHMIINSCKPKLTARLVRAGVGCCRPISRVLSSDCPVGWSFLWERSHPRPRAAYPQRLDRGGPPLAAYLALLPLGFAVPRLLPAAR